MSSHKHLPSPRSTTKKRKTPSSGLAKRKPVHKKHSEPPLSLPPRKRLRCMPKSLQVATMPPTSPVLTPPSSPFQYVPLTPPSSPVSGVGTPSSSQDLVCTVDGTIMDETPVLDLTTRPTGNWSSSPSSPPKLPKPRRYRLSAKKLFLTFPQCVTTVGSVVDNVKTKYGTNLQWVVAAVESHADGHPHLHIGIALKSRCNYSSPNCLDDIAGQHGDYRAMKNQRKCLEYITKCGNYQEFGINTKTFLTAQANKQSGKLTLVATMVSEGKSLRDVDLVYPGIVLQHKKKIEEYLTWKQVEAQRQSLQPWKGLDMEAMTDPVCLAIGRWLDTNIKKPRDHKQKQLYIWGPVNVGKTYMVMQLIKYLSTYVIPASEDFYDFYEDKMYDLAVLDEFKANKTVQWLNQWLEGSMMNLRKKGAQYLKVQNIPTIILSNYRISEVYTKVSADKLLTLEARLDVIEVTQRLDLKFK